MLDRQPKALNLTDPEAMVIWKSEYAPVTMQSTPPCLVELGETDARNYQIRVDLEQTPWTGNVGVFLGYADHPTDPTLVRYELLAVEPKDVTNPAGGLVLQRLTVAQQKAGLQLPKLRGYIASAELPPLAIHSKMLLIQVRDNRLHEVSVGLQTFPQLVETQSELTPAAIAAGWFGIYMSQASVLLRKAEYRFTR